GEVGASIGIDVEPGAGKKRDGRLLQAAFRDSQTDLAHRRTSPGAAVRPPACFEAMFNAMGLVKHDRVPSWQTRPSPCTFTRNNKVSLSQSVAAETTCRR